MERQVRYNENTWGTALVTEKNNNFEFRVYGKCINNGIFRAYAVSEKKDVLLIGVLEPTENEMSVRRSFTKSNLINLGFYPNLPQDFFICENKWDGQIITEQKDNKDENIPKTEQITALTIPKIKKTVPKTKDSLINEILTSELISWEITGSLLTVYCEYNKQIEFPLSFAFSVCTIEERNKKKVACYRCWLN